MELVFKASALSLFSAVLSLLLRKRNPETALLLSALTALGIMLAAVGMLNGLRELREQLDRILGKGETLISPVLKCLAVSIVTRFSADLCRDSAQNAAASSMEFAGAVCAVAAVLPLLMSVLKIIGGLI